MGDLHDRAVEEIYDDLNFLINEYSEEVFWDDVFMEQDYFEGQHIPYELPSRDMKGKQVGEFDVLAVSHDPQVIQYVEVKPFRSGVSKAEDQIGRAESFWEPRGWDVVGSVYRVPEWEDNWYDEGRDFELVTDGGKPDYREGSSAKYSTGKDWKPVSDFVTEVERDLRDELGE